MRAPQDDGAAAVRGAVAIDVAGGPGRRMRVLLGCSTGGHRAQLHRLKPWWEQHERAWVRFRNPDAESLLAEQGCVTESLETVGATVSRFTELVDAVEMPHRRRRRRLRTT